MLSLIDQAVSLADAGQWEQALAVLRRALALSPGLAQGWDRLSDVALALGRTADAGRAVERALLLDGPTFARMDVRLRIARLREQPAAEVVQRFAGLQDRMTEAAALPMDRLLTGEPSRAALRPLVTPAQRTLLRVLFSPKREAAAEFGNWLNSVDIKDLESGSYRLYPYLYRKLVDIEPNHPLIGFIKGNYRKTFYRNNLLLHRVSRRIKDMNARGIDVLVLKGAALVESQMQEMGLRPMADVDILVGRHHVPAAMTILGEGRAPLDERVLEHICRYRHGHTLEDEYGFEVDLHWNLTNLANIAGIGLDDIWETSEAGVLFGADVRFLSATDQFFHLCVHGVPWNPEPPIRWIADAMTMLRDPRTSLDWDRLVEVAVRMRSALLLRCALLYLIEEFAAPVPAGVLAALEKTAVTPLEWHLFPFQMAAPGAQASHEAVAAVASDLLLRWRRERPGCRVALRHHLYGFDARLADWCRRHDVDWIVHGPCLQLTAPAERSTCFEIPRPPEDAAGLGPWLGFVDAGADAGEAFATSLTGVEDDLHIIDARSGYALGITKSALLAGADVPWKTMQAGSPGLTGMNLRRVLMQRTSGPVGKTDT